ncbi:MAG: hypothetical protein H5U02_00095 [Clostridia bacterium]|nr:hypothetical protein [Clostridia bacterium]
MEIQNEATFKAVLFRKLVPYFDIRPEVTGWHLLGQKLRIDALLKPRFIVENVMLGLEVKAFETRSDVSVGDYTAALKQAIDYSLCRFEGRLPDLVLLYPGILSGPTHKGYFAAVRDLGVRLAGQFRIGELKERNGRFAIYISDTPLWRSNYGLTGAGKTFRWTRGL